MGESMLPNCKCWNPMVITWNDTGKKSNWFIESMYGVGWNDGWVVCPYCGEPTIKSTKGVE